MIQQWGLCNDIQQIDRLLPTAYIMDINEIVRAVHWLNSHLRLHIRRSLFLGRSVRVLRKFWEVTL